MYAYEKTEGKFDCIIRIYDKDEKIFESMLKNPVLNAIIFDIIVQILDPKSSFLGEKLVFGSRIRGVRSRIFSVNKRFLIDELTMKMIDSVRRNACSIAVLFRSGWFFKRFLGGFLVSK